MLESVEAFPIWVCFWRRKRESSTRHRCPLIDSALGIFVESTVCVDTLHTCALGVTKTFLHTALWK
eukprot:5500850-Alexandrium_andersonii.AAC.1